MQVVVVGAGEVGQTAVESLQGEHDCTVVDLDPVRLESIAHSFDVRVVEGNGAGREALMEAGVADAGLVLACTSRDEVNLVTAVLARRLSRAQTVVRTTDMANLDAWRAGDLDVDFMVSSWLETANAVARVVGVPGTRQADFFLDGDVQVLELDVPAEAPSWLCGRPLQELRLPSESTVVGLLRGEDLVIPGGEERLAARDRVIVVASRSSARDWSRLLVPGDRIASEVAVFGGAPVAATIARVLLDLGTRVRLIEPDADRAQGLAAALPDAGVYHASGFDAAFLRRERIGRATSAVFAMREDPHSLYAAVLAKVHDVPSTIAVLDRPAAREAFEAAGVDSIIDPGAETAEVMVRFAHDRRTRQIAMLENDRFEVLDVELRTESRLVGRTLQDLPPSAGAVGVIVRDGRPVFPSGGEELSAGDRVIVLVERSLAGEVEREL